MVIKKVKILNIIELITTDQLKAFNLFLLIAHLLLSVCRVRKLFHQLSLIL